MPRYAARSARRLSFRDRPGRDAGHGCRKGAIRERDIAMRNTLGVLGLSVITLVACAPQQPVAAPLAPPPAAEPIGTPAPAPVLSAEPPKAPEMTAEQKVEFYEDCWANFSAHDLAKFGARFPANA